MKKTALILMLSMCSILAMYAEGAEDSFVEGIFKYEIDGVHGTGDSVKVSVDAVIPNGVKEIGDYAFYDIPVKHIAIPKSVDSISTKAFMFDRPSCVTSIQVDKGNPVYDSRDNCNAIIKTASNTLCLGCDRTQIPGSVQAIGDNAFTGTDIGATLILPEGVEEIGDRAFASCRFLNYIVLPCSIKRIAFSAFPSKKLQPIFKQDATKVEFFKIYSDTSPSLSPLLEAQWKREKGNK